MLPTTQKVKSFWKRPEGVTGFLFLGALITGGAIGLYKILPYLLTLVQNTIYLTLMCAALFGILYVLLDPQFRAGMWYLYKIAMRKITGVIITIDPIGILKIHIENLKQRREDMSEKMVLVNGQKQKLTRTINDNNNNIKKCFSIIQQAERVNDGGEIAVQNREIGRTKKLNERLQPLQKKLDDLYDFLLKLYKNSDYIIRDMESEIRANEIEYKAVTEGSNAIKSAKSIFSGGDDQLYKQAVDYLEEDMSNKIGEIDQFMRTTDSIIKSLEYENGAFESEGYKMLEQFKESDFTFLLNKDSGRLPNSPEIILIPKTNNNKNGISDLLD